MGDVAGIDEALVRSLLQEQQPGLAGLDPHGTVTGWGGQLLRLRGELVAGLACTDRAPDLPGRAPGHRPHPPRPSR